MKRYVLSAEAKQDLADIRSYFVETADISVARYVLREIKNALVFLSRMPGVGHSREDLTDKPLKFWSVFSYLIIYKALSLIGGN
jgi:plasmid stabilization system protein ParE